MGPTGIGKALAPAAAMAQGVFTGVAAAFAAGASGLSGWQQFSLAYAAGVAAAVAVLLLARLEDRTVPPYRVLP